MTRIQTLADGDETRICPGHDGEVTLRFPDSPGVYRFAEVGRRYAGGVVTNARKRSAVSTRSDSCTVSFGLCVYRHGNATIAVGTPSWIHSRPSLEKF